MTCSVNFFLRSDGYFTYRAVLTCGKTLFGTSRSYRGDNNLGVTESCNVICIICIATVTGVGCITLIGTGRIGLLSVVAVTLSGNNGLSYESYVTNGAVLTLGKTCFGTSGSNCLVGNFCVTGSGNNGLSYESLIANGAVRSLGKTCLGTSRSNCLIGNCGVTRSGNCERVAEELRIANLTVIYIIVRTFVLTIGSGVVLLDPRAECVTLSVDHYSLTAELVATNGTVYYVILRSLVYTIGINEVLYDSVAMGVTLSADHYGLAAELFVTNGTVNYVVVRAVVFTIGISEVFYNDCAFGVTKSVLFYIIFSIIALCTVLILVPADLGAGGILGKSGFHSVSCVSSVAYPLEATRTDVRGVTACSTGIICYDRLE